jgi:hypothetical protein
MKKFVFGTIIMLMTTCVIRAQDDWFIKLKQMPWLSKVNKIALLKSTRQDAEQILGIPEDDKEYSRADWIKNYNIENGRVTLTFTTEECTLTSGEVKKGVVEKIGFSLKSKINFKSLKLPLQKFEKSVEDDVPSLLIYENKKNGITIYVEFGNINSMVFVPPESENSCPDE